MPKERFHLLLADEYLKFQADRDGLAGILRKNRAVFLLGAISPDIFFYDLPFFTLNSLGNRLHVLVEQRGPAPLEEWLSRIREGTSATRLAWAMGFASHVLADGLWHPVINDIAFSLEYCRRMRISPLGCHRLVESEMESFWLTGNSAQNAYLDLLKGFAAETGPITEISRVYRELLADADIGPLPSPARIRSCFLKQNRLLRLFANPLLGTYRDRLLLFRGGRYLGALVVSARPSLPARLAHLPRSRNPFSEKFMEEAFTSLAGRLSDFAERLRPYLPS